MLQNFLFAKNKVTPKASPLSLSRLPSLLACLDMPQHIRVVMLTLVERAWNGHERPARSICRESIVSLVVRSELKNNTFSALPHLLDYVL